MASETYFYRCQTEEGPQYRHTMKDAAALDPNYVKETIKTDKLGLMEHLNNLMRQPSEAVAQEPGAVSRPAPSNPGAIGSYAEGNEAPQMKWMGDDDLVKKGEACNVCLTRKSIESWKASSDVAIHIETIISSLTDPNHIAAVKDLILDREAALSKKGGKK